MSIAELRVKALSLGAEARIIRDQERIWRDRARRGREALAKAKERAAAAGLEGHAPVFDGIGSAEASRLSLYAHRTRQLRPEARATNIALGFLKGRAYAEIENAAYTAPNWARVEEIARKFGGVEKGSNFGLFGAWKSAGEAWLFEGERLRADGNLTDRRRPKAKPAEPRQHRTEDEWL